MIKHLLVSESTTRHTANSSFHILKVSLWSNTCHNRHSTSLLQKSSENRWLKDVVKKLRDWSCISSGCQIFILGSHACMRVITLLKLEKTTKVTDFNYWSIKWLHLLLEQNMLSKMPGTHAAITYSLLTGFSSIRMFKCTS